MSLQILDNYNEKEKEIVQANEDFLNSVSKLAECGITLHIDYDKLREWQNKSLEITPKIS